MSSAHQEPIAARSNNISVRAWNTDARQARRPAPFALQSAFLKTRATGCRRVARVCRRPTRCRGSGRRRWTRAAGPTRGAGVRCGPPGLASRVPRAVAECPRAFSPRRTPATARPWPSAPTGGCAVRRRSASSAKGACRQLRDRVLTRKLRSGSAWLVAGGVRAAVQTARERCRWLAGRRKPGSIRSGRDPVRTDVSRVFIPARRLANPRVLLGMCPSKLVAPPGRRDTNRRGAEWRRRSGRESACSSVR
jgi:hypothetical protein